MGTRIEVADEGDLVITSKRGVFRGARQTLEIPWSRLLGVDIFEDGIQFHISNRKSAPLLRVPNGDVVAAAIYAVAQGGVT